MRSKKLLVVLVVILLLISILPGCGKEAEETPETQITVATAQVTARDVAKSVNLTGTTKGKDEVYVIPKAPARVTAVLVKPGQAVSQGQALINLDSSDVILGVDGAKIGLNQAELQLANAATNLERMKQLHDAGALSTRELEEVQSYYDMAEIGVEQARIGLENAQQQLSNFTVTSPINGVVGSIDISVGDMANPSSPAAIISNTSQLEIEVLASESDVNYIKEGSEAIVHIKAASDEPFVGKIETVSLVPDPMKRNYVVKVLLPNEEGLIRSGMFAQVSIATESKQDVVSVPAAAIVPKGNRTVVYVVDAESRAQETEVKVGLENSQFVEIVEGVKLGDAVITRGNTLVDDGTLVRVTAGGDK